MTAVKKFSAIGQEMDYLFVDNGSDRSIVLLHGYGANMRDLAGIAPLSPEFKKYNWYFPDGIIKVPIGPYMTGKAWFPIDMELLNRAIHSGGFEHLFSEHVPEGLDFAAKVMGLFLTQVVEGDYILGGFSQGSMLSNYLVFEKECEPLSLLLLSSTLVARNKLEARLTKSEWRGPIFQSHGVEDPVLPIGMARELKDLLEASDRKVDYHEFHGGHEIPPAILQGLINFLKR